MESLVQRFPNIHNRIHADLLSFVFEKVRVEKMHNSPFEVAASQSQLVHELNKQPIVIINLAVNV